MNTYYDEAYSITIARPGPYVWSCFTIELSLLPLFWSCFTIEKNNAGHALKFEQDLAEIITLNMEKISEIKEFDWLNVCHSVPATQSSSTQSSSPANFRKQEWFSLCDSVMALLLSRHCLSFIKEILCWQEWKWAILIFSTIVFFIICLLIIDFENFGLLWSPVLYRVTFLKLFPKIFWLVKVFLE